MNQDPAAKPNDNPDEVDTDTSNPSRLRRFRLWTWGWFKFSLKWTAPLWVYLLTGLIGLIPVNRDFEAAHQSDPGAVKIFVQSTEVHADILVPISTDVIDWAKSFPVPKRSSRAQYVAFGWGDRGFYLQTPTWEDLTVSKVGNAMLLPSESVMHLAWSNPKESVSCKSVVISKSQYRKLVRYISSSFKSATSETNDSMTSQDSLAGPTSPIAVDPQAIHEAWRKRGNSHFYEANGSYHAFNTCNCWVGSALKQVGIRTAWFTPFPRTVFLHWPDEAPDTSTASDG